MTAARVCAQPGCPELVTGKARWCDEHDHRTGAYTGKWRTTSRTFLAQHPRCIDCGQRATIADHAPRSRRQLVAARVDDPDHPDHLEPRCAPCHARRTARDEGSFGR